MVSAERGKDALLIEVTKGDRTFIQTGSDLRALGYAVQVQTGCVVKVSHRSWSQFIYCRGSKPKEEAEAARAPAVAASPTPAPAVASSSGPALYGMPSPAASPVASVAPRG
ncbi:hypothetical protein D3C78_1481110 [compost metagenome]